MSHSSNMSKFSTIKLLRYTVFDYREVPQVTTGSPFNLLYGRYVRRLLDVLKEEWTEDRGSAVSVATYVMEMRE